MAVIEYSISENIWCFVFFSVAQLWQDNKSEINLCTLEIIA